MTLPRNPNLAWTLSFWLAAVIVLAAVAAPAVAVLAAPLWSAAVLAAAVALAAVGLLRPEIAERAYRGWNAFARRYAAAARAVVLRACYFVVITATSRTGARLELGRSEASRSSWVAKSTPGIETCGRSAGVRAAARWAGRYLAWSRRSGNAWAACLLPFVLLLMALDEADEDEPPASLYTLY
ncbi:MAG: hypothetical protein JXB36_02410 [Gammaproteobacteria bacterium]|nr:hypothetical protein [Gammaproteobacteria bacterium]